ncbi:MAG: selenocysteine-specific translation elongation factor, partial [Candidatus Limnocylindrales bacterium]
IDHGKTTLLRALTGIDADRLPEERRRGMTIDVGYAHLALEDGTVIDFVDVPGHDKLVGNMLVGAGEVDAALLVVAADDGPRAQTLEHLGLLDALGVERGIVVVTKVDAVDEDRIREVVAAVNGLLTPTGLAGSPVMAASGVAGTGLDAVRAALADLAASTTDRFAGRPATLAIDRMFAVKGRGTVVTGTLRGGPLARGDALRLVPGDRELRVREIQVHGTTIERADGGARTALNLGGISLDELHRGDVLTADPAVRATSRALVTFRRPVTDRTRARLHSGTASVDAEVGRAGRDAMVLPDGTIAGVVRLANPMALAPGDRFVLRRGPGRDPIGGVVLDIDPARGISRRRQSPERVGDLANAINAGAGPIESAGARRDLHGALPNGLADDVAAAGLDAALAIVTPEIPLVMARTTVARALRRAATLRRDDAVALASRLLDEAVRDGRLVRDGDRLRRPGARVAAMDPKVTAAMDRLEAALAVPAPPPLTEAARSTDCPPDGVRALERAGRIVVLEPDLAYAMSTYRDLAARALAMAADAPLTPAAYRDVTGTSRKYVMAILEDLDRKAILRRTPDGHVPGPKAPAAARS